MASFFRAVMWKKGCLIAIAIGWKAKMTGTQRRKLRAPKQLQLNVSGFVCFPALGYLPKPNFCFSKCFHKVIV